MAPRRPCFPRSSPLFARLASRGDNQLMPKATPRAGASGALARPSTRATLHWHVVAADDAAARTSAGTSARIVGGDGMGGEEGGTGRTGERRQRGRRFRRRPTPLRPGKISGGRVEAWGFGLSARERHCATAILQGERRKVPVARSVGTELGRGRPGGPRPCQAGRGRQGRRQRGERRLFPRRLSRARRGPRPVQSTRLSP